MPIRFRCAYCNQLLGIARRKAGTVVRCPTCAGQVVVPSSEAAEKPAPTREGPLFERSDFDDLFLNPADRPAARRDSGEAAAPAAAPPAGAWGTHAEPAYVADRFDVPRAAGAGLHPLGPPPGLVLSPGRVTLLSVLTIVALGVSFVAGLLVGAYFMR
jgi:phage FluMu protein Com